MSAALEFPFVSISPAMRHGEPTINGTRITVEAAGDLAWGGASTQEVADDYTPRLTRADILVACWWLGRNGSPRWRKRWRQWAEQVDGALWSGRYDDAPDPPDHRDAGRIVSRI